MSTSLSLQDTIRLAHATPHGAGPLLESLFAAAPGRDLAPDFIAAWVHGNAERFAHAVVDVRNGHDRSDVARKILDFMCPAPVPKDEPPAPVAREDVTPDADTPPLESPSDAPLQGQ